MLDICAVEGDHARPSGATDSDFMDPECSAHTLAPCPLPDPGPLSCSLSARIPHAAHLTSQALGSCACTSPTLPRTAADSESHLRLSLLSLPLNRPWRRTCCQPRTRWWRHRSLASCWTTACTKTSSEPSPASVRLGAPLASLCSDSALPPSRSVGATPTLRRPSEPELLPCTVFSCFSYLMMETLDSTLKYRPPPPPKSHALKIPYA